MSLNLNFIFLCPNSIGSVMFNMLDLIAVNRGLEDQSGKTRNNEIGTYCFFANTQHKRVRAKTCWHGNRPMCPG